MKKLYIKPTLLGIVTLSEEVMEFNQASKYSGPTNGDVETDESPEGSEVDAAAKGFNAWTTWDEE